MKRLLFFIGLCLLMMTGVSIASGPEIMIGGRFVPLTITGVTTNISDVAGSSFLTNVSGGTPSASTALLKNPSRFVSVCNATYSCTSTSDCAGANGAHCIYGYIGNAGTGETTGSDIGSGLNLSSGWSYTSATNTSSTSYTTNATPNFGFATKNLLTVNTLYKTSYSATNAPSAISSTVNNNSSIIYSSNGATNIYKTANNAALTFITNGTSGITLTTVTSFSMLPILTPSSSGVNIANTRGGATHSFIGIGASFDPNTGNFTINIGQ